MIFVFKLKCRYFGPQFPFKNIFRSVDIIPAHRDAVKVETQKRWELCVWSSMNTIAIVLIHRMMIGVRTHINDEFKLMDVVRTKNTSCTYHNTHKKWSQLLSSSEISRMIFYNMTEWFWWIFGYLYGILQIIYKLIRTYLYIWDEIKMMKNERNHHKLKLSSITLPYLPFKFV